MTVRRPARLAAVGVAALAATLVLTACDDVKYTDDKPGDPKASAAGAAAPGDPMAGQAAGSRCRSDEITATVQVKGAGSAMLTIRNKSDHNCTLYGYPGFNAQQAGGGDAAAPAANHEAHPGPAVLVTLKPNKSGYAGLKWTACDKADAGCHVLTGLQVTAPDEITPVMAELLGADGKPGQLLVSAAGFTVGTLQPNNEKVLFN